MSDRLLYALIKAITTIYFLLLKYYQINSIGAMHSHVEKTYKKVSQIEHILLRPDTYIGSIREAEEMMWVVEGEEFIQKKIKYVPGLYKIFDEILLKTPDMAMAHFNRGLVYMALQKTNLAQAEYEILLRLDPKLAKDLFQFIYL